MQKGTSARRIGRLWSLTFGRRHAIAVMTAASLMALPFTAHSQTSGPTGEQANPGTPAVSPAPAAAPPAIGVAPSAAPAPTAPAASAPAAPASATLPGEHMISGADLPEDLSPWGMFENSDLVVKAVIIGLALARS